MQESIASIPDYLLTISGERALRDVLWLAAGKLRDARDAAVILNLLANGASFGLEPPPATLQFPRDHNLHLKSGQEWYYLACDLEVEGRGLLDRIGVFVDISRTRMVSLGVQQKANWSDADAQIVSSIATVTLATETEARTVRRRPNVQAQLLGGQVEFGAGPLKYRCGPDSIQGTGDNVLPLRVVVDDGDNMEIDLTLSSPLDPRSAFFLQGRNGTGIFDGAAPGFYYSWPQLLAAGTVTVAGKTYKVKGAAWIDHQLMTMATSRPTQPDPPVAPPPLSGWKGISPYDGWNWCQFNLSDGNALTFSAFQQGTLKTDLAIPDGYYVRRKGGGWEALPIVGQLQLDRFIPASFGEIVPLASVTIPTRWSAQVSDSHTGGQLVDLSLNAAPWYPDASLIAGNLTAIAETPGVVAVIDRAALNSRSGRSRSLTGTGYCETFNYEPIESLVARSLAYLAASEA
jgi:hypothetical protein